MAGSTHPHFAGSKGEPVAFPHHAIAVGVRQLPGEGAASGHKSSHGAICPQRNTAGGAGAGWVVAAATGLRQQATAVIKLRIPANLQPPEKLQIAHIINMARFANRLDAAGHTQIEGLLSVQIIPRGHIAADHQRQILRCQKCLYFRQRHARLVKHLLFWRGQGEYGRRGAGARPYLHRIQFPQHAVKRDHVVWVPKADLFANAVGERCAGRPLPSAGRCEQFQPEFIAGIDAAARFVAAVVGVNS